MSFILCDFLASCAQSRYTSIICNDLVIWDLHTLCWITVNVDPAMWIVAVLNTGDVLKTLNSNKLWSLGLVAERIITQSTIHGHYHKIKPEAMPRSPEAYHSAVMTDWWYIILLNTQLLPNEEIKGHQIFYYKRPIEWYEPY